MQEKEEQIEKTDGKMLMHFSDGVLDMTVEDNNPLDAPISETCDPKTLDWGPWTFYMTKQAGTKALEVCDYLGESLASFFGITTPKYQFEINEYHKMIKAAEEEKRERDVEMGSWVQNETESETVLKPPQSIVDNARF